MRQLPRGILFLVLLGFLTNWFPHDLMAENTPIVIAHRGASGYLPEHTLPAKAMAYAMGADFLEQDVVLSKDHVPMVLHDIHVDTISDVAARYPDRNRADGRYYAIDFTLDELKSLSVSERIDLKTGKPVFAKRFPSDIKLGLKIPTLAEEIELTQGLNKSTGRNTGIYPEIKQPAWHRKQGADISKIVLDVLNKYGYSEASSNIYFQCFDPTELKRVRHELGSKLKLVQLLGQGSQDGIDYDAMSTDDGLAEVAKYSDGIGPSIDQLLTLNASNEAEPTQLIERAHRNGLKVHPYTLRRDSLPNGFRTLAQLTTFLTKIGIDGVFSDFPDLTRAEFDRHFHD